MGGDAAEGHPAGAVLDEHQDVKSSQQRGVNVQGGTGPGSHGAAQSFVVAAELGRELSGIQADLRHREAGTQYMPLASALCLGMRPDVGQWNCAWRRGPVRVTL
jgi:hypothetical protein